MIYNCGKYAEILRTTWELRRGNALICAKFCLLSSNKKCIVQLRNIG